MSSLGGSSYPGGPLLGPEDGTPRQCERVVREEPSAVCGKPAVRHLVYWWDPNPQATPGYEHGFACAEHWEEFKRKWKLASHHELGPVCGMPGSLLFFDGERSWCEVDELPVAEKQQQREAVLA